MELFRNIMNPNLLFLWSFPHLKGILDLFFDDADVRSIWPHGHLLETAVTPSAAINSQPVVPAALDFFFPNPVYNRTDFFGGIEDACGMYKNTMQTSASEMRQIQLE